MRSERAALGVAIALLLGWFVWAYHPIAALWPWGTDAERWLDRGDPSREGWATWVFGTRHFVGYRPFAALSYAVDAWLPSPSWSNALDVALMAAILVGVVWVGRALVARWTTPARATAAGVLAGLIVALHPVVQEVVPFTARRSYLLAEGLGLAALACLLAGLRAAPGTWLLRGWGLGAAALLGLACGSNEAIFPLACLVPVLCVEAALAAGLPAVVGLPSAAVPLLPVALLVAARNLVLEDDNRTGYVTKYFAYTDGNLRLAVLSEPEPLRVFGAAWSYVLFPSSPSGDFALFVGERSVLAGALVLWLVARGVLDPIAGRGDPARRLPLWLLLWGAVTASLYAIANTWFWREGFPLLVPVAFAIAAIAVFDLDRARPLWRQLTTLTALLGVGLSVGWWSPLFGLDRRPLLEEIRATRVMERVMHAPERLSSGAVVWMIPVGDPDFARDVLRLAGRRLQGTGVAVRILATLPRTASSHTTATVSDTTVVLPAEAKLDVRFARTLSLNIKTREIPLASLTAAVAAPGELWWWEGAHMRTFHSAPLPAPTAPAPAPPALP